jgi:flagellar biosynthetic protein FliR
MRIAFDSVWIAAVLLIAIRLGPLFILTPVLGSTEIPVRVRVLFALALSAMLVPATRSTWMLDLSSASALVSAAMVELVIGAALAFGLLAAFAAFLFGGRLLDLQVGFGVASLIDPNTRGQAPLLGTLLNLVAIAVFFAANGHHIVIRGLAQSLDRVPPGTSLANLQIGVVVAQFGVVFISGLAIVAPVVFALFLLDVAMAVAARTMPQLNVFIVSMPLKVLVGLLMLALSASYVLPGMQRIFETITRYWNSLGA